MTAAGSGEASPQRARHFCVATFADPGGKGRCLRRSGRFRGRKKRLRSVRGRFCVATFAVPAAKGAAHGGRGALAGGKGVSAARGGVFAWQFYRSGRQRALPTAVGALSRAEKTPPQRAGAFLRGNVRGPGGKGRCPRRSRRSRGRKKRLRSVRGAFLRPVRPHGRANRVRRARSHLWRSACSAPSAAISSPAPTRGAGRFSASRASMHRPPKTQMASRR